MCRIRNLFFLIVILLCSMKLSAQLQSNISAFYKAGFLYNPAFAGNNGPLHLLLIHKKQWGNYPGHPIFSGISGDMSFNYERIGTGINIIREAADPAQSVYANGNFSYKINFWKGRLSFGGRLGMIQRTEDLSKLSSKDPDPLQSSYNKVYIEEGGGFLYKEKSFFVGFSLIRTASIYVSSKDKLKNNYNIIAGIEKRISGKVKAIPSLQFRYINNFPAYISAALPFYYKDLVMAGMTYNSSSVVSASTGLNLGSIMSNSDKAVFLIYTYDHGIGRLSTFMGSSHELMLTINFNNLETPARIIKRKITVSPIYFD